VNPFYCDHEIVKGVRCDFRRMFSETEIDVIYSSIIEKYEKLITTFEEKVILWTALAEISAAYGWITNDFKIKAVNLINEYNSDSINKPYSKELFIAMHHITLYTPPVKKKNYKPFVFDWKCGDVYAYQIKSEKMQGRWVLLMKVSEICCGEKGEWPVFLSKVTEDLKLPDTEKDFANLKFARNSWVSYDRRFLPLDFSGVISLEEQMHEKSRFEYFPDEKNRLWIYRFCIIMNRRTFPKRDELVYLGNYSHLPSPDDEFIPHINHNMMHYRWGFFDELYPNKYLAFN